MKPKTRQVYEFIIQYKAENDGNSPSNRQIMKALGFRSPGSAHYHLMKLEEDGLIETGKHIILRKEND